jgi:hypothetical protein
VVVVLAQRVELADARLDLEDVGLAVHGDPDRHRFRSARLERGRLGDGHA